MGACTHRLRRVPGGLSAAIADGLRAAAFGGGVGAADGDDDAGEGCTVDSYVGEAIAGALQDAVAASSGHVPHVPPPSLRGGRRGEHEAQQRERSVRSAVTELDALEGLTIEDVLNPDPPFESDPYPSSQELASDVTGVTHGAVYDSTGEPIDWPWEERLVGSRPHTGGKRRRHRVWRLDEVNRVGLFASAADGSMGAKTTGVRKWKRFCASEHTTPHRPLDPNAPLSTKLAEEWLFMRFVAALVEEDGVLPNTAAGYAGQVQGWHAKEHGVKIAAGMKLSRLPAMLKGALSVSRAEQCAGASLRRRCGARLICVWIRVTWSMRTFERLSHWHCRGFSGGPNSRSTARSTLGATLRAQTLRASPASGSS